MPLAAVATRGSLVGLALLASATNDALLFAVVAVVSTGLWLARAFADPASAGAWPELQTGLLVHVALYGVHCATADCSGPLRRAYLVTCTWVGASLVLLVVVAGPRAAQLCGRPRSTPATQQQDRKMSRGR